MSRSSSLLQALAGRGPGRDRLVVLLGGLLGLSADKLRSLTLVGAVKGLAPRRHADVTGLVGRALRLLAALRTRGLGDHEVLFPSRRSRKHRERLGRSGLFRVLQAQVCRVLGPRASSPLRLLQSLSRSLLGLRTWFHTSATPEAPTALTGVELAIVHLESG